MQKLKNAILDKLIEKHVTAAELDVLLYISRRQSEDGWVAGVYYREVSEALHISFQTFYNALNGLEEKEIIRKGKGSYYDIDVQILNNRLMTAEERAEGYIQTNKDIFRSEDFQKLKANEKLLAMYICKVAESGRGSYHIGVENFYDKFTRLLGVSRRIVQRYLTALRKLFSIGIKEGKYWITPRKIAPEGPKRTDKELYAENIVKAVFRRNRAKYTKKDFKDIQTVVGQYADDYKERIIGAIGRATQRSLYLKNENKNKYKWDRKINPAYIHKLLQEELTGIIKA